jgi:uncharacterized protein YaaN involved in tellurite resistance
MTHLAHTEPVPAVPAPPRPQAPAVAPVRAPAPLGAVAPDPATVPGLDRMAGDYVDGLLGVDPDSREFGARAESVRTMGDDDIRAAAEVSNRMLQRPVRALSSGGPDDGGKVSSTLLDLRRTIESLDPKEASGMRKILGLVPFGDRLRAYFHRYEKAQAHIDAILHALYDGQDELRKDNAALEQERVHLADSMRRLGQYVYVAERLDAALGARIAAIEEADAPRAQRLREDVLFYVRQKRQDLLTQMAVSIQAQLAIDLVRRNNIELVKGVDRATTTTISALRTAVIVAQALASQRLVLNQITALDSTTSSLIDSTSQMLATNTASINEQASSSTIGVDALRAAFDRIYETMDSIDAFKQQALGAMQGTVDALHAEIVRAEGRLARVAETPVGSDAGLLRLPGPRGDR